MIKILRYTLTLKENSTFTSNAGVDFISQDFVDFSSSSSFDPTEISIYSLDANNEPQYYLLKKQAPVISAQRASKTFDIGEIQKYLILELIDNDIISIESIIDSDGNEYTEVPYLAQDTVFENISNVQGNTTDLYEHYNETPYLLKIKQVPRRFVTRFTSKDILEIQFGAGDSSKTDEQILPIPDNIGLGGKDGRSKLDQSIDPSNFLHSQTYGKVPSNTKLSVAYLTGGGIRSNVLSQTINTIATINLTNKPNINGNLLSFCRESLACNNPEPATGGGSGDTTEDVRTPLGPMAPMNQQREGGGGPSGSGFPPGVGGFGGGGDAGNPNGNGGNADNWSGGGGGGGGGGDQTRFAGHGGQGMVFIRYVAN